jgi:hypothetical protein
MRPDDVNFSLSTSSEILSEKADLISRELLQSVLFAVNLPIRIDRRARSQQERPNMRTLEAVKAGWQRTAHSA